MCQVHTPHRVLHFRLSKETPFTARILVRESFFAPSDNGPLEQISTLIGALYYCRLFHLTWQRRGYIYRQSPNLYAHNLFVMCEQIHNEYAVARLKNMLLSQRLNLQIDATGQTFPFFTQYGTTLAMLFDQVPSQLQARGILQFAPLLRKGAMLPTAYRFIFEPLARHAGFLAPIPSDYPGLMLDNIPEKNAFYQDVVAPYWISIKSTLEKSFANQFSNTEEELQVISKTLNSCLDELLEKTIKAAEPR